MKSTSSLVMPTLANTSAMTGWRPSASLRSLSLRTFCDWANEAMETGRTVLPAALTGTPLGVVVGVRLAVRPEVLDRGEGRDQLGLVHPHGLDPHAHTDLVSGDLLEEAHEREVGPVQQDLGTDIG